VEIPAEQAQRTPVNRCKAGIQQNLAVAGGYRVQNWSLVTPKRRGGSYYWLAISACAGWKIPAPEICDAIRKAATTAGRLISLRN
jgi:hypothetical protein